MSEHKHNLKAMLIESIEELTKLQASDYNSTFALEKVKVISLAIMALNGQNNISQLNG